jgi:hypothetical protein
MVSDRNFGIVVSLLVGTLVIVSPLRTVISVLSNGKIVIFSVSLLWGILFESDIGVSIQFYDPMVIFGNILLCGLRFAFPLQLLRYYREETSLGMAFLTAFVGEIIPLLLIFSLPLFSFLYVGPIPYQIIAALIILALKRPIGPSTAWDSDNLSLEEIYS